MKIGIILFIIGSIVTLYFSRIKIEKKFLTEIAIVAGILCAIYGVILMIQPNEDNYVKFTKTTISKLDTNNTK
jgi:uncharacterized membrane protein